MAAPDEMLEHSRCQALLVANLRLGNHRVVRLRIPSRAKPVRHLAQLRLQVSGRLLHHRKLIGGPVIPLAERRHVEEALDDAGQVAAIAQVLKTGETRAEERRQLLTVLGRHAKVPLKILLNLHLRQALLRLLALREHDAPVRQVRVEIIVDALFVALVAVDVGGALGGDGSELDGHPVARLVRVAQRVRVAVDASHLFPSAAQVPAFQA